jgi:thioredoxin-related protein
MTKLKADTTGKHMFIDFTASWCGWCKKMDREAFVDPQVVSMLNGHFFPVRVWGDSNDMLDIEGYKISERNLAVGEFRVSGYPAFWFISPEQSKIGPLRGYQTTERLVNALTWVKDVKYDTTGTGGSEKREPPRKKK